MSEVVKNMQNENPDAGEKTFSQEDVNRIVGERLAKEKARADAAAAEREKQLIAREMRLTAKETLNAKGLPGYLVDALDYTSEETMNKGLELIEKAILDSKPKETHKIVGVVPASSDQSSYAFRDGKDRELRSAFGLK